LLCHVFEEGDGLADHVGVEKDLVDYWFDGAGGEEFFQVVHGEAGAKAHQLNSTSSSGKQTEGKEKEKETPTHLETPIDLTKPSFTKPSISFRPFDIPLTDADRVNQIKVDIIDPDLAQTLLA